MNQVLAMNFVVDKTNKKINVEREFKAPLALVWAAWTQGDLLDQWWAPKPWQARTKLLDFTPGGMWLYAMVSPKGEEHWSRCDFKSIVPLNSFSRVDGFSDEQGAVTPDMPRSFWENTFSEQSDKTLVRIEISFDKLSDLEMLMDMRFKE